MRHKKGRFHSIYALLGIKLFPANHAVGKIYLISQALMKRILFLCSQNKLRSPTAADIFADTVGIETDSAGLNNDAVVPLSAEQIEWDDLILLMENAHKVRLNHKFKKHLAGKSVAVLGILDDYAYMDEELVELLKVRCADYLPG